MLKTSKDSDLWKQQQTASCSALPDYLDIVSMTRAVCVSIMSVGRCVFYMRGVDGDSSRLLLRGVVYVLVLFIVSTTSISEHWGPKKHKGYIYDYLFHRTMIKEVLLRKVGGANSASWLSFLTVVSSTTFRDGRCQGCLAMVNMANSSDVHMGFVPAVCLLCLRSKSPSTQWHGALQDEDKPKLIKYRLQESSLLTAAFVNTHQLEGAMQKAWWRKLKGWEKDTKFDNI